MHSPHETQEEEESTRSFMSSTISFRSAKQCEQMENAKKLQLVFYSKESGSNNTTPQTRAEFEPFLHKQQDQVRTFADYLLDRTRVAWECSMGILNELKPSRKRILICSVSIIKQLESGLNAVDSI